MALLTRAQIDEADDTVYEDVPVAEWGGEVRIIGMSGTDRNAYQTSLVHFGPNGKPIGVNLDDRDARLLARCLVDEDGQPLYTLKEVGALGAKNGAVIERLAVVARRLSGIGERAVEEAEGNSEPAPSGSSTSD
ncbi:hypothetical protein HHL19_36420 [Streptomyces sp. R302]|uniref:hypothetical protein n=1 Tax=unclassified Streptomyces TaxID=2593676 RepID=UPI00145F7D49|nr:MULTISPECIES: hypothetical protein [unclassified Streptomyces]NML55661.1 hypothetical protein [Streptomyces sp. R301]NML83997.1 hypothetical protein [Streptomyces sp. R302]